MDEPVTEHIMHKMYSLWSIAEDCPSCEIQTDGIYGYVYLYTDALPW